MKFCIAFSGGLDSSVVLNLFAKLMKENSAIQVRAIHIHHGLSPNADSWAEFCLVRCQELAVPCEIYQVQVNREPGQSIEAVAREQRYQALLATLAPCEVLVTGHHQNDQAETLILQLMRGAGVKGLAGMPMFHQLLFRPLLPYSRAQLQHYAEVNQLIYIEDESNLDEKYDRNFLRQQILPMLSKRWPAIVQTLGRTAKNLAEANELLDELAELDKPHDLENRLDINELSKLSAARQRNVLRYWLQQLNFLLPNRKKIIEIQNQMLAQQDANPFIAWQGGEVRRYRNYLYACIPVEPINVAWKKTWLGDVELQLPNAIGSLRPRDYQELKLAAGSEVLIGFRQNEGEGLKKHFQKLAIPPWKRDRIPLVFYQDELYGLILPKKYEKNQVVLI